MVPTEVRLLSLSLSLSLSLVPASGIESDLYVGKCPVFILPATSECTGEEQTVVAAVASPLPMRIPVPVPVSLAHWDMLEDWNMGMDGREV